MSTSHKGVSDVRRGVLKKDTGVLEIDKTICMYLLMYI